MREITTDEIRAATKKLLLQASYHLCSDIKEKLMDFSKAEVSDLGKDILNSLIRNAEAASRNEVAICQDTGMVIVFMEIGQDAHVIGGDINDCINQAVKEAYEEGYLRKSVVSDPLNRINTGDNTPAIIYYEIVPGENINIKVMPKGFGSENMSDIKMLKPSDGVEAVIEFIIEAVKKAGPNPCPPIIVGVGIGGTMEKAALLSKKSLLRPIDKHNTNEFYEDLEKKVLYKINNLGIGPQGLGGITTALGVNIEYYPTHIAGLPVAVNISCHATRHAQVTI